MPFVQVEALHRLLQRPQKRHAAETEDGLLTKAVAVVATIVSRRR